MLTMIAVEVLIFKNSISTPAVLKAVLWRFHLENLQIKSEQHKLISRQFLKTSLVKLVAI